MDPWFAKAIVLLATILAVVIRAPHGRRSRAIPVLKSRRGPLWREAVLTSITWGAFCLTMLWIATPVLAFADYPLHPISFVAGSLCLVLGLWLFHRSHVDLGTNWSITLQVREQHRLVTHGVFRWVRHPMYLAMLIYFVGQALVLPNWLAGPSCSVAMVLLICLRLGPEESMMREEFGKEYEVYMATTKRLIPGVW